MKRQTRKTADYRRSRGFTLVEIIVVIAIIAILVTLGVMAGAKMKQTAKRSQTVGMLAGLTGIEGEYQGSTTARINSQDGMTSPFDWTAPKTRNVAGASGTAVITDSIERFVWAAWQVPSCRNSLPSVGKTSFVDSDANGFYDVIDAFGKKLMYVSPGATVIDGVNVIVRPEPYFASVGIDGRWGDPAANDADSLDNLYSFRTEH